MEWSGELESFCFSTFFDSSKRHLLPVLSGDGGCSGGVVAVVEGWWL